MRLIELVVPHVRVSWEDPLDAYRLEVAGDPDGPWWTPGAPVMASSWSTRYILDVPQAERRFYRLRKAGNP